MRAGWGDDRRKKQRGGETRRKEGDKRGGERERSTYHICGHMQRVRTHFCLHGIFSSTCHQNM